MRPFSTCRWGGEVFGPICLGSQAEEGVKASSRPPKKGCFPGFWGAASVFRQQVHSGA